MAAAQPHPQPHPRSRTRLPRWLAVLLWTLFAGCGPTIYTVHVLPASRVVEQAEEAGAAEHAPYEYHYAAEHLKKAREEAAEASYQDAIRHAGVAEEYGVKARDLARRRLREMGR
ncbi:MAG TPA: DUF4398 domain-containing protein [Polyangiaceae bacterium LLY-WYZ-15_(1-7)]|nr:hypothetical protein [Myxococcales bacterium]MAT25711.1 hypothetical protein [Sandaracinus sp.]HJK99785.1 DUF4398 domain-containing protein [Polyangiaceae bacterium LLY-WYZ-15_(1-7)]MBJ71688.1 hypothetical protein [Sandaracinus sp.]HJL09446.1 DUF4398 domain-containing protein [Polyangiaceae bacterium LLY-WYZ-15_(1-7)]